MDLLLEDELHKKINKQVFNQYQQLMTYLIDRGIFKSLKIYKKFTLTHYYFYEEVMRVSIHYDIDGLFPYLKCRTRYLHLKRDLEDLYIQPDEMRWPHSLALNKYEVLGWLYVSEGIILLSHDFLQGLKNSFCLSEYFAARNLAGCYDQHRQEWAKFIMNIDLLNLDEEQEHLVVQGALTAFKVFKMILKELNTIS